jgi:hypothetical protein
MPLLIRIVTKPEELDQVLRLRYRVYVEEMGLDLEEADHERRVIKDELDERATILAAFDGDEVVGTVCVNTGWSGFGKFESLFKMEQFRPYFPHQVSMSTRLVVAQSHRNTSLGIRLSKACFETYQRGGSKFDFICIHERQRSFFERQGYRRLSGVDLPGYGDSHVMVMAVADWEHLAQVRSPFASLVPEDARDGGSVDFFYERVLCVNRAAHAVPGREWGAEEEPRDRHISHRVAVPALAA